ncbi:hypothetical protein ES332_D04G085700v1 [Gossypium tomentosum]|uniref:BZIP domain-containing protein n=1 Tax=Gossypium tomentosum TaxID=34277 RepID=A0A5D2LBE3_GOSTO|nr:hypothetical protein ES332_D04G085700v1 [Gossypium tomentosum]
MKENMEDGEIELSDHVLLSNTVPSTNFQDSTSVDLIIDEYLKNTRTCSHTHTCNPPGPDVAHSHTCYHTHTQLLTSEDDDYHNNKPSSGLNLKPRRSLGNREAVRKYREKKKAHTAYLEEEVKKLRLLNQQLVRKLQGQTILEAEVLRLRSLLVGIRAKVDSELGVFPFHKQCANATILKEGDCGVQSIGDTISLQCQTDLPCFHPHPGSLSSHASIGGSEKVSISLEGNCQPATVNCQANEHNSDDQC